MSKLQIDVAARPKTAKRNAGDQKSRKVLVEAVVCTRDTMPLQSGTFKPVHLRS